MMPFCPSCARYSPAGRVCAHCGVHRSALETPGAAGQPAWSAQAPGSAAGQMAVARDGESPLLIVPWGRVPRRGDARPADGGVVALSAGDGRLVWKTPLGQPIEGGACVAEPGESGLPGQVIIVGAGTRGIGAGEGWLTALDVHTGREVWPGRARMEGAVRAAPVVDGVRLYAAACDGALYCLDLRTGQRVWRTPLANVPIPIPAAPVIVKDRGAIQAIITGTYGGPGWSEEGKVIAVDERGRKLWEQGAGGNVRGAPALADGVLYVAAFRNAPSTGIINALDARTGRSLWRQPFIVQGQPTDRRVYSFSAAPLAHGPDVYVPSLNGRLYKLNASNGQVTWECDLGVSLAVTPAWIEGLIVLGANDGRLVTVDPTNSAQAWQCGLENPVLTAPLAHGQTLYAATEGGKVVALPWHLGQYAWAAERLERQSRHAEAGDCRALAAHFGPAGDARRRGRQLAARDWNEARQPERAGEMWLALDEREEAARAFAVAGEHWRMNDDCRAAGFFKRAADLFFPLRQAEALNAATRALATCAQLPYLLLQGVNVGSFFQWEPGEFTLRLVNEGQTPLFGAKLWLGGALKSAVGAEIPARLDPGAAWNIPLTVVPTREQSALEVEVEYIPGAPDYAPLRGMAAIPIAAIQRPQPLNFGDIQHLQVMIGGATREGVNIVTGDVALLRANAGIGDLRVAGDAGAVIGRDGIGAVQAAGDVGFIRNS